MAGRMRIIGIDPGTNLLGFGVIDVVRGEPVLVDMDVLDLRRRRTHMPSFSASAWR